MHVAACLAIVLFVHVHRYEELKLKIDADTAAWAAPDINMLLAQYHDEASKYEAEMAANRQSSDGLAEATTATARDSDVTDMPVFEVPMSAPGFALTVGTLAEDELERDVQDARRQQSIVKAAEVSRCALCGQRCPLACVHRAL